MLYVGVGGQRQRTQVPTLHDGQELFNRIVPNDVEKLGGVLVVLRAGGCQWCSMPSIASLCSNRDGAL